MSKRVLITLAVIVLVIIFGTVMIVKRSLPTARKGDPNAEPRVTQPAPKK